MKRFLLATIAAGTALAATAPALAAQGCGPGGHRGAYGHCRPNGPGYGPGVLVVGRHYDRGWWDGHRYWHNRYRYGHGWRYR